MVEVQRGQQIKLIPVVSDSGFDEYYWKDLIFFITFPSHYCSANCKSFKKHEISK
jgi:hypothetical protein